jgi:dihydroxy-acid dehydratase
MSTAPKDFCEGCTCGRAEGRAESGGLAAPEAYEAAARDARSFTAPMDIGESEGIEPAVPLRSKMWFNNPEDGQSLFYSSH